ncbi:MAG: glycosyltransferase [Clostridiaceae bacterium]|nr:glycosyltransferase [Clostridiaceae bacterium]
MKNIDIAKQILEMNDTLIEASNYLYDLYLKRNYSEFYGIASEMNSMIEAMYSCVLQNFNDDDNGNVNLALESIMYSLDNIIKLTYSRSEKALSKIKYELIPLIEEMKLNFYYWVCLYPDQDKINDYYKNEMIELSYNKHIDEAIQKGEYKYDLSIVVVGYNKLEYTKLCVENVLKHVPKDLNYELILVNHGSTDGTKEYFESINPTKQLDILKNGGGLYTICRIVEGKYTLSISNDVVVTENAISNMLKCMESDEKIAYIVPTTPNVSNNQTIDVNYSTMEEMHKFAAENNKLNSYRWEQRVRLCNPISMIRNDVCYSSQGIGFSRYYNTPSIQSFPDDVISLHFRRNGYKMVLAKDAYCHHFGSVTLKDEITEYNNVKSSKNTDFYLDGRKEFMKNYKIDPWGIGFCWDYNLIRHLNCNDTNKVNILGINCGLGSNPLKIKEEIKEKSHNLDVKVDNFTDEEKYVIDLEGVSDFVKYVSSINDISGELGENKYKYIVFESNIEKCTNPIETIKKLNKHLEVDGVFAVKIVDDSLRSKVSKLYEKAILANEWIIIK